MEILDPDVNQSHGHFIFKKWFYFACSVLGLLFGDFLNYVTYFILFILSFILYFITVYLCLGLVTAISFTSMLSSSESSTESPLYKRLFKGTGKTMSCSVAAGMPRGQEPHWKKYFVSSSGAGPRVVDKKCSQLFHSCKSLHFWPVNISLFLQNDIPFFERYSKPTFVESCFPNIKDFTYFWLGNYCVGH